MVLHAATLLPVTLAFSGAVPYHGEVVGQARAETVAEGDSLVELARRYDLGFAEIAAANPRLDPFVPPTGSRVVLPTAFIVPEALPGEIVVNLSEMRLYLILGQGDRALLVTFPVGIGVEGASTPLGTYHVTAKARDPTWHVPASVRREEPDLPAEVPPGPDNPLGSHALRLSRGAILIHGTDKPFGVGRRVSHGCIRLYPEDIPVLYALAPVGTTVRVVREPVKVGLAGGRVHVEVHAEGDAEADLLRAARKILRRRGLLDRVDASKLEEAVRSRTGVPVDVARWGPAPARSLGGARRAGDVPGTRHRRRTHRSLRRGSRGMLRVVASVGREGA